MKPHPSRLKRPDRKRQRFEFVDPLQSEPWVWHLQQPNDLELDFAKDQASKLIARYVTGGYFDEKGKWQEEPDIYHSEGEVLVLSESSIQTACRLSVMQPIDTPEEESYSDPMEILELIPYYPTAFNQLIQKHLEFLQLPKAPKADLTS